MINSTSSPITVSRAAADSSMISSMLSGESRGRRLFLSPSQESSSGSTTSRSNSMETSWSLTEDNLMNGFNQEHLNFSHSLASYFSFTSPLHASTIHANNVSSSTIETNIVDVETPPRQPASSRHALDPVFEFGEAEFPPLANTNDTSTGTTNAESRNNNNHNQEKESAVTTFLFGCVLLLIGGLIAGGISMLVNGARGSGVLGVRLGYSSADDPDSLGSSSSDSFDGLAEDHLLPLRNVSDNKIIGDDDLRWDDCQEENQYRDYLLQKMVRRFTNRTALRIAGSPQHRAFQWLVETDSPTLCPSHWDEASIVQRYLLAVFYYSTQGKGWQLCSAPEYFFSDRNVEDANNRCKSLESLSNFEKDLATVSRSSDVTSSNVSGIALAWLTGASECHWGGVTCDDQDRVVGIGVENNDLAGTLPAELQHLSDLRSLKLPVGKISGPLPSELGNLAMLEALSLEFNMIRGSIPTEIYSLGNLTSLNLSNNMLTGSISPHIQDLHELSELRLDNNFLVGSIPVELASLPHLNAVSLQFNDVIGPVPLELCVGPSPLAELTLDCHSSQDLDCPCCSFCF
ncbi:expressed unknown protein [Seminavis robusta]|uniref:Leucine-rich repeat-containing N-terminal plant-type domain-containing protein n=1 Tax=Seminavis robusta TaxID=568900 RepID=A0A9N8E4F8_9STRA|nr:expressed unknown protein [Seminavis robusta]|eukprot:Sro539_g162850.1 n/a (573) ;mRNA; f:36349-38156